MIAQAACDPGADSQRKRLLRVELDDQLLLQRHIDLRALGQLVNQDAQAARDDLQPAGDRTVADGLASNLERQRAQRLLLDIDDVVLRDAVAGDVDLHAVDGEVAVADQLAGLTTGTGQTGAVHDVVQTGLEDAQQVVAGLTRRRLASL